MNTCIYYMWNFKPSELNDFLVYNKNVIDNNSKYINESRLIEPYNITLLFNFIKTNDPLLFPNLEKLYNIIPYWVIKTDLARLLIIYYSSGIYCDVDCFIQKKFDNDYNIILFTEEIVKNINSLGPRELKNTDHKTRIANYFFYSKIKKHPFLKEVIDECLKRLEQIFIKENNTSLTYRDILWCCGPDVITTIYHSTKNKYTDIYLCDQSFLNHAHYFSWK